jgi:hypothetical protein
MSRAVTLAGWAVLLAGIVVAEVAGRRARGTPAAAVLRVVLHAPTLHLLVGAAWLWLGWHLFVRASHG